jgi:MOSC domain-containing protein YiiM
MAQVISVNVGRVRGAPWAGIGRTAMDKQSVSGPVTAHRLGLDGDQIGDTRHHGGPDQAVYAFAREDLDWWEVELGREIRDGQFAENLTTRGIDVNEAEVGERWRIGSALFEVAMVRIPCNDFKRAGSDATATTSGPGSSGSPWSAAPVPTCASSGKARSAPATSSRWRTSRGTA